VSFPRIGLKHKDAILYSGVTGYPSFFFIILLAANDRAKRKKEGWWSVRELRRNAPKFPVDSCPGRGTAPLFMVLARLSGDPLAKKSVALGAIFLYTAQSCAAKMEIPVKRAPQST
jgi:hypothetical protein